MPPRPLRDDVVDREARDRRQLHDLRMLRIVGSNQAPSAGPQLQEMTSAPLSAAQLNASASRCDPRPEASRIGISFAAGATPEAPFVPLAQATPAQAVP